MPWGLSSNLSQNQTLLLTSLASVVATTSIILSFQALRREHRTELLKKRVGKDVEEWEKRHLDDGTTSAEERIERWAASGGSGSGSATPAGAAAGVGGGGRRKEWRKGEFDEGLIREQLTRNYNFLGEESMDRIRNSYVVVVGCGGVGSWCALMLLRSGVGKLLLIDFDMTTLSSLNRHACATLEDVGSPKVVAMQKFLKRIAPWAEINIHVGLWRKGEGEPLLEGADWVVDAIDNIDTKVDLLAHCHSKGIKVFSSMGSGAKRDPTRVQIADISNTYEDPLARSVRRRLRVNGVSGGIPVVYSTETPSDVRLLPLAEEEFSRGKVKELQPFDDFRVRILPVLGPLPALFGLNIATYILLDLAGKPLTDYAEIKHRKRLYSSLFANLGEREARIVGNKLQEKLPIGIEDVGFIFEDLYRGRSSLPPYQILPKPCLARWDIRRPLAEDNVVVLSPSDAKKHEEQCLTGEKKDLREMYGEEAVDFVDKRSEECRRVISWRNP